MAEIEKLIRELKMGKSELYARHSDDYSPERHARILKEEQEQENSITLRRYRKRLI
jgi:hypothetical protein